MVVVAVVELRDVVVWEPELRVVLVPLVTLVSVWVMLVRELMLVIVVVTVTLVCVTVVVLTEVRVTGVVVVVSVLVTAASTDVTTYEQEPASALAFTTASMGLVQTCHTLPWHP